MNRSELEAEEIKAFKEQEKGKSNQRDVDELIEALSQIRTYPDMYTRAYKGKNYTDILFDCKTILKEYKACLDKPVVDSDKVIQMVKAEILGVSGTMTTRDYIGDIVKATIRVLKNEWPVRKCAY